MMNYLRVVKTQPLTEKTGDFRQTLSIVQQGPHITRYTMPLPISAMPTRRRHIIIDISSTATNMNGEPVARHFCYLCGKALPPWNDICEQHNTTPTRRLITPRIIPMDQAQIELIHTQHMPNNMFTLHPTTQRRAG